MRGNEHRGRVMRGDKHYGGTISAATIYRSLTLVSRITICVDQVADLMALEEAAAVRFPLKMNTCACLSAKRRDFWRSAFGRNDIFLVEMTPFHERSDYVRT